MDAEERAHDFARDPDAEDREGVVEGIVFGDGGPVEDGGGGPDTDGVEEGGRCLRGEEGFAEDDDGGVGYADVFLGAALDGAQYVAEK